ncbi:MAG TPA: glycosyltransferase family 4 protein [Candidatus Dormibacteraeota bacterium]|jgi:glycosyltransferase involved in cell wall biosynthesis|nr:glycosyltransferase family 4 protein [Candidatus Dormibacteraeota bacterium]
MRILFLTHFFPPEVGAPQTRILETARGLISGGDEVMVLTSFPNYPTGVIAREYRGKWLTRETIEGIPVVRSWLYAAPNRGFAKRILNHVSFAFSAVVAARKLPARPDVIAVDMHPIFLCFTAYLLARRWRIPYVINAGDLIPEQAVAFGALTNPVAISLTRRLRDFVCRRAGMIVPFTRGIGEALAEIGMAPERIELWHYGANTEIFTRPEACDGLTPTLRTQLEGRFVVMYAGTHGLGQGLEVVLGAADLLRADPEIAFLMVGDGSEKPGLVAAAARLRLTNVIFIDPVRHEVMPSLYGAAQACLVSLRPIGFLGRMGLPSKLFEVMAAGRPVILAAEGESVDILSQAGAGLAIPPGRPEELAGAIQVLRADPVLSQSLGAAGRSYIAERMSRDRQTEGYRSILCRAVEGPLAVALA